MTKLLFLTQRIPYPPNKGDKLRAYRILAHWARTHDIFLGSFVDDPADEQHIPLMQEMCADAHIPILNRRRALARSMSALARGQPQTLPYYRDRTLARWVAGILERERPSHAFVFSSSMAQYVLGSRHRPSRLLIDFVDVDSRKWADYASHKTAPASSLYRREARTLARYERIAAADADASILVSEPEAQSLRELAPQAAARIHAIANGIDCSYFAPGTGGPEAPIAGSPLIVFTGHMDYWPNIDAASWFAKDILPLVQSRLPQATFAVVGANPTPAVIELAQSPGVTVTGRVADVRPYLDRATVAVAPMRVARGVQNKVLEGMAMAKTVVTTPQGLEGIDAEPGRHLIVADAPQALADAVVAVATGAADPSIGAAAREWLIRHHSWEESLAEFDRLLQAD